MLSNCFFQDQDIVASPVPGYPECKQIFMQEIESATGQIDISRLNRGLYIMKIHGNETVVRRFIKN